MARAPQVQAWRAMGLIVGLVLAGLAWTVLWRRGRLRGPALQLVGAALLLGLGGYSLQGQAGLAGSPASERLVEPLPPVMPIELASEFYGRFNTAYPWLVMANGYAKRGDSGSAVATFRSALKAYPRSSQLWIGLGNALVAHGAGRPSPAAMLAFNRSATLAPKHPGPRFFYGLALLRQGRAEEALALWRQVARDHPADATWQANLRRRIALLEALAANPRTAAPPAG